MQRKPDYEKSRVKTPYLTICKSVKYSYRVGPPPVAALALVCHAGFLEATPELSGIWIQDHDGDNKKW